MARSVFVEVGGIIVWLAGRAAPTDAEWHRYTAQAQALAQRRKERGEALQVLVITDAGAPTPSQRVSFMKALHGFEVRTAVVSTSTLVRGVASVFSWFNIDNRVFNPKDFAAALAFAGVGAALEAEVWDRIAELRATVAGGVDTVAAIAHDRPHVGAA